VRYGGNGCAAVHANGEFHFPGESATLLRTEPRSPEEVSG